MELHFEKSHSSVFKTDHQLSPAKNQEEAVVAETAQAPEFSVLPLNGISKI